MDDLAPKFFADEGIKLPKNTDFVPSDIKNSLASLLGMTEILPHRPCGCIVIDDERMLVQNPKQLDRGVLIHDKRSSLCRY